MHLRCSNIPASIVPYKSVRFVLPWNRNFLPGTRSKMPRRDWNMFPEGSFPHLLLRPNQWGNNILHYKPRCTRPKIARSWSRMFPRGKPST